MTTTRRMVLGSALLGVVLALPACQSSCAQCGLSNVTISAAVRTTHITAPPGGGSRQFVEVLGRNFHPNVPITLSFRQYPASDANRAEFSEGAGTDGSGSFRWEKDLFQLPPRNFQADPSVDVWITAKETVGACFAMTSLKTQQILHPPL
jgi:hypothetical protein